MNLSKYVFNISAQIGLLLLHSCKSDYFKMYLEWYFLQRCGSIISSFNNLLFLICT